MLAVYFYIPCISIDQVSAIFYIKSIGSVGENWYRYIISNYLYQELLSIISTFYLLYKDEKPSVRLSAIFRHAFFSVISTRIDCRFAGNKAPVF